MQFKAVILAFFATLTIAQDLSGLPTCAQPCFLEYFPDSGCDSTTDYVCLCESTTYNDDVLACVLGACDSADQLTSLTWAENTCASVNVTLSI